MPSSRASRTARPRRSSAVRPTDRPARRGRSKAGARGRVGAGRSPLNPGFPRWAVLLVATVVVVAVGAWVLFSSSFFGVRKVEVVGEQVLTEQQVIDAVALGPDTSLVSVRPAAVANRVKAALKPVARAEVSRSWPGTVVVRVTERTPVATVEVQGQPWLIDAEAVVYAEVSRIGERADGLIPLEVDQPTKETLAAREAAKVLAGLDQPTHDLVAKVEAPSAAHVTLILHDGRQVIWGDSSMMNDKLTMLPAVLEHSGSVFDISSPSAIVIK